MAQHTPELFRQLVRRSLCVWQVCVCVCVCVSENFSGKYKLASAARDAPTYVYVCVCLRQRGPLNGGFITPSHTSPVAQDNPSCDSLTSRYGLPTLTLHVIFTAIGGPFFQCLLRVNLVANRYIGGLNLCIKRFSWPVCCSMNNTYVASSSSVVHISPAHTHAHRTAKGRPRVYNV